MYNSNAKKQNRILLICLVVILAAATVLVAITGSANRSKRNEKPPFETESNETEAPATKPHNTVKPGVPDEKEPAATNIGDKTDDVAGDIEKPDDKDVSVMQPVEDALPKFSSPIDTMVIKGFSVTVPVFSYTMNDYRTHGGIDFACSPGTPVLAAADGTVCEIKDDPMMGVTVAVQHTGGAVTKYKGLSEESMNLCKVGDTVKRGQVIGASGETALIESAEEAHLHFELYVNGEAKDPGEYMKVTYLSDVTED